jgi:hypothetical protein
MNIAVLVYGRLDNFEKHYRNIISTLGEKNNLDFFLSSDNSNQDLLCRFIEIYKPKSYVNDNVMYSCNLSTYEKKPETNIHNMICHFINKKRVFNLLENYIKETNAIYDIVIALRIDLHFESKIDFNTCIDNTIYIPNSSDWGGINDQLAYGNLNSMKKYMNIFDNIIELLDTEKSIVHPETLTLANINHMRLEVVRFDCNYFIDRH